VKLVVPFVGELHAVDARLIRLAEFLGIRCETLPLAKDVVQQAEYLERAVPDKRSCFVVNPRVMEEWVGGNVLASDLVSFLLSRFPHLFVHGIRLDAFDANIVAAMSRGRLQSIHAVDGVSTQYQIAKHSNDVCGAFSGLSFGPTNPANDHVFSGNGSDPAVRTLISIGDHPIMAVMKQWGTEVLFLGSEDTAELNAEAGDAPVIEHFSRLVPHTIALRHVFAEECWHPCHAYASLIIDDPLLRRNYGFLNFESLLRLMKQHNFHTTIAFIPHNFGRSSPAITKMFRENTARFALCFHGNDHTGAEFASADTALLNTMLQIAERRMNAHQEITGLHCDKVMVFPQGKFSSEAMEVLKRRNFSAAVNTVPHPSGHPVRLTIGELAQPAVLRYRGFPLFLRTSIRQIQSHDIAFNLLYGKPVLIVAHHDIFQRPESLAEIASRINIVSPGIHWSNLASVVGNSILRRRAPDGTYCVRAYSSTVQVSNDSGSVERFSIEWCCSGQCAPVEQVLKDGTPCNNFEVDDARIRVTLDLAPGTLQTFSVVHRNVDATLSSLGFRYNTNAFLRRRLSEVRDNYLSKNQRVLSVAKILQRSLLH